MPRTIIGRPKAPQRKVVEEWIVTFTDPDSSTLVEITVFCNRGTFFDELPTMLIASGYNPEQFDIEGQGQNWWREQRCEHR